MSSVLGCRLATDVTDVTDVTDKLLVTNAHLIVKNKPSVTSVYHPLLIFLPTKINDMN
ncbi:hypothetical protein [Dulcicalothrix desertica]|uniref:hypothetical protein n=1 Tax=Dulcicalothrix desertica TaxID=32056 RepID=UPI00119ADF41|nr:hypothetical protein [Dulcicalothrix desertica]TWH39866.1 hypothetical protein CAL7102_09134 [Dulcicalothrix desertica PCC 7102]